MSRADCESEARHSGRRSDQAISPLRVPLLSGRLGAAVEEAAARLVRTSFSTIIRDANDYVCLLLRENGDSIAENATAIPAFNGCLPRTARALLASRDARFEDGDVFITNDPWLGTGHLYDMCVLTPLFMGGRFIGFCGSVAHVADVGGSLWGVDTRSVHEEGLRIPLTRLRRGRQPNEELIDLIRANVRVPDEVIGDIFSLMHANDIMAGRVRTILAEEGHEDLREIGEAICAAAEQGMRARLRAIPDGDYVSVTELDGYGSELRIACRISIRGDAISVDYSGSSPQQPVAINVPINNTFALTAYVIKCVVDPVSPRNEGTYRPIQVTASPGSILNAAHPAPVNARHLTFLHLASALMQALAPVLPQQIIAESGSPFVQVVFSGVNARGRTFVHPSFDAPGMGARHDKDGLAATPYPNNTGGASIETVELNTSLRYLRKALVPDSGGPGRFRGGLGTEIAVTWDGEGTVELSILGDRVIHPARGVLGGRPGMPALVELNDTSLPAKGRARLAHGDVLRIRNAGGGGYGPPALRDARLVEQDLRRGFISREGARAYA
jgi:N-methylhydantoinase B